MELIFWHCDFHTSMIYIYISDTPSCIDDKYIYTRVCSIHICLAVDSEFIIIQFKTRINYIGEMIGEAASVSGKSDIRIRMIKGSFVSKLVFCMVYKKQAKRQSRHYAARCMNLHGVVRHVVFPDRQLSCWGLKFRIIFLVSVIAAAKPGLDVCCC